MQEKTSLKCNSILLNFIFIMIIHKGEVLRDAVYRWCKEKEISLAAFSRRLGQNPSTTYRHFEREDLPTHTILKYAKVMDYSFSKEFPELEETFNLVSDHREPYGKRSAQKLEECQTELQEWKEKYLRLLEKHNELLMEIIEKKKEGDST